MNYFHALILGLVEGLSEFLPISSTAHLILTSRLLGLPETEFLKSFQIAIQLGAILSVVVLYWRSFLIRFEELKRIVLAFIPTAIVGLVLYKLIKQVLMEEISVILVTLFIGGIILILFEKLSGPDDAKKDGVENITYSQAILIGLCQALAVVPGVSRAAATIIGAVLLGVRRKTAVEFSFLLAVPTMAAAVALDLLRSAGSFSKDQFGVLAVGFLASFVFALAGIKFFLTFIQKHSFISFGVYRIVAAVIFWILLIRA